jgi:hypothetical protein
VPDTLIRKVEQVQAWSVDLRGDGSRALIGSFAIEHGDLAYPLFAVGESDGSSYRVSLAEYERRSDIGDHGYDSWLLVGVVDLDGDGAPELVVQCHFYEVTEYAIYRRQGRGWKLVYGGGGHGC